MNWCCAHLALDLMKKKIGSYYVHACDEASVCIDVVDVAFAIGLARTTCMHVRPLCALTTCMRVILFVLLRSVGVHMSS